MKLKPTATESSILKKTGVVETGEQTMNDKRVTFRFTPQEEGEGAPLTPGVIMAIMKGTEWPQTTKELEERIANTIGAKPESVEVIKIR